MYKFQKINVRNFYVYVGGGGAQKFLEMLKKKLFIVFVQVRNFSPLRSTPPVTGCSNPSATPNAGNIV
jgi:hypothetical protein